MGVKMETAIQAIKSMRHLMRHSGQGTGYMAV